MFRAAAILKDERDRYANRVGAPLRYTILAADALIRTLRELRVFNAGVGVEAVDTDAGGGAKANPPLPNHSILHGFDKWASRSGQRFAVARNWRDRDCNAVED